MIKIFKYLKRKEWLQIIIGFIFIVTQVWLDLKIPDYMAQVTRLVKMPGGAIKEIWQQGALMVLCALGSFVSAIIVGFLAARVGASFARRIRALLFSQINSFSAKEINYFSTASLITRSTNDIGQVRRFITFGLQVIVKAPIMAVWAISKISGKGFEWSLVTGGAVLLLLIIVSFIIIFVLPKFRRMQALIDDINQVARENLNGLEIIRAYNAEDYQKNKFEIANKNLTSTQLFTSRSMSIMDPMMSFIMGGLSLAIYWSGAYMINLAGQTDRFIIFSNMIVFSSYAIQVVMSFMMLAMIFVMWPRASVSAKRINEIMNTNSKIIFGNKSEGKPGLRGELEFKNINFRYPEAQECVLQNINFKIRSGETVAFIGSTGSGKTTLVNLIPRFFDASSGEILLNGINIKEYSEEALYRKISYIPQKAVLFRGTVKSNIAYGQKTLDFNKIREASEIAQGSEFIETLDGQYEAEIAQGGTNLSGGQKQRLAIARAVSRPAEIFIFDDSFSALDYKTDRLLRQALKDKTRSVTKIIIAQRIGTIIDADQIIVLHDGKIVGRGKHQDLLNTCKIYREIASSQLNGKELRI